GRIAVLGTQIQDRLHRRMRGDVTRKTLEHDRTRGVAVAEAVREFVRIELAATEYAQEAELAFEHARRAGKTLARETRRQHAAFGCAPKVEALHHGAGARAGEFQQSAGERARDAKGVLHALFVEIHQLSARNRGAERAGGAGCVKAAAFVAVFCRAADADHHLGAGDDGGEELAPAHAALLGDRKAGSQQPRAATHPRAPAPCLLPMAAAAAPPPLRPRSPKPPIRGRLRPAMLPPLAPRPRLSTHPAPANPPCGFATVPGAPG